MAIYAKTEKPYNGVSIVFGVNTEERKIDLFYRVDLPSGRQIEFHGGVCDNNYHINEYGNNGILPKLRTMFYYAPLGNWSGYIHTLSDKQITKTNLKIPMEEFFEMNEIDKEIAISERRNFLNLSLRYNINGGI